MLNVVCLCCVICSFVCVICLFVCVICLFVSVIQYVHLFVSFVCVICLFVSVICSYVYVLSVYLLALSVGDITFREASISFGCDYDEGGNLALGELYREVAYGILPELVTHVLKMDPQADGLLVCLHAAMVTLPSISHRRLFKDVQNGY